MTIWLVLIWDYKHADEKEYTFLWRRKNGQSGQKTYCVNPLDGNKLQANGALVYSCNVMHEVKLERDIASDIRGTSRSIQLQIVTQWR